MKRHECKFCKIASSDHECLSSIDQPIYEDESFYAICSVGGFISGWSLIFPKEHTYNLSNYYLDSQFIDFITHVKLSVEKNYGKCIVFEHGALEEGLTSCGVNHAHLHIVPFEDSIEKLVKSDDELQWEKIYISELANKVENSEYLFCSDSFLNEDSLGLVAKLTIPQSQYFRKILANFYGIGDLYSYKTHKFEDQSLHTHKKLKKYFSTFVDSNNL